MLPFLYFAVFARDFRRNDDSIDMLGIFARQEVFSINEQPSGVMDIEMRLFVAIAAELGPHELVCRHVGTDFEYRYTFEILQEHAFNFMSVIKGLFPVLIEEDDIVNEYPLSLDGVDIGSAHLISHTF